MFTCDKNSLEYNSDDTKSNAMGIQKVPQKIWGRGGGGHELGLGI